MKKPFSSYEDLIKMRNLYRKVGLTLEEWQKDIKNKILNESEPEEVKPPLVSEN